MPKGYPDIETAKKILKAGAEYKEKKFEVDSIPYVEHSEGVADAAEKIASKTLLLNPEKAYVLGLLHDYGHRIIEKKLNRFHGQEGYDELIKMGYNEAARICLTHTFPDKDFNISSTGYPIEWMKWAKEILKDDKEYDDYDRLIQLCDKIHEEGNRTTIEERVYGISKRYNLSFERKNELLEEGLNLKKYFDNLCGEDIYKTVGIKNNYPTYDEAERLLAEIIQYRNKHFPDNPLGTRYIGHIRNVGKVAKIIAEHTVYLNPEKSHVLGLLHDCGKRQREKDTKKFHGRDGYEFMLEKNYQDVAKICLTHTFPNKNKDVEKMGLLNEWTQWAKEKLEHIDYDDYDKLIQLSDKLCEEDKIVRIEDRIDKIISRYNLDLENRKRLIDEGKMLKDYFDKICNEDIYNILGI